MVELKKKKYKRDEVEEILDKVYAEHRHEMGDKNAEILELQAENKRILYELVSLQIKEKEISSALTSAQEKAIEVEKNIKLRYSLTVENLRIFNERWRRYFEELKEKYPLYPAVKQAISLKEKMDKLLASGNNKAIVEGINKELNKMGVKEDFSPKDKINEFVAATETNGFNIDEVLNPGELQLEDLCKELGVMEEKN